MPRRLLSPVQLTALVAAALFAGSTMGGLRLEKTDFATFYAAAAHPWASAAEQLALWRPNLNPPTFTFALQPLALLPMRLAFTLWCLAGAISLVASIRLIHQRLHLSATQLVWVGIACAGCLPFTHVWAEGQVVWFLLYLLTRAWVARTPTQSGFWLGLAIALKPPLACMALCFPFWPIAGVVSLSISLVVMSLTGLQPWLTWLEVCAKGVYWVGWPLNVSIWSVPARIEAWGLIGKRVQDLSIVSLAIGALALAVQFLIVIRSKGDRRWVLATLWSIFVSPAAWLYYLPLTLGPAIASWPRHQWTLTAALICLSLPMPVLGLSARVAGDVFMGSVYTFGGWLAFAAWSAPLRPRLSEPASTASNS